MPKMTQPGAAGTGTGMAEPDPGSDEFALFMQAGHRIGQEVRSLEAQERFGESEPLHRRAVASGKACLVQ